MQNVSQILQCADHPSQSRGFCETAGDVYPGSLWIDRKSVGTHSLRCSSLVTCVCVGRHDEVVSLEVPCQQLRTGVLFNNSHYAASSNPSS
jgi:hypothetical protein